MKAIMVMFDSLNRRLMQPYGLRLGAYAKLRAFGGAQRHL